MTAPTVTVTVDRARRLTAGSTFYRHAGASALTAGAWSGPQPIMRRVAIWHALAVDEDPDLTVDQVARWLDRPRWIAQLEEALVDIAAQDMEARSDGYEAVPTVPDRPCPVDELVTPAVPLLADRPRWLVRDMRSYRLFEEATAVVSTDPDVMGDLSAVDEMAFVWAGLVTDDPTLTRTDVEAWLDDPACLGRVARALIDLQARELALATDTDSGSSGGGPGVPLDRRAGSE